jgi:N-acetylglutamate synthase-like GNAT family acetyltransferase
MLISMSAEQRSVSLPQVHVRHLAETPAMIPLLAKWHHEQWGHLPGARTEEQRAARLHEHLQLDSIPATVVAWLEGQPVGCASLVANDMDVLAEWIPWLANVYVRPEKRRQGIGALLVERIAAETLKLGYPRLYLYTIDQMHFYEQLGWQTSHVRFYRGHDMTVMTRDLIVASPHPSVTQVVVAPTSAA